jgi:hypothetical protein
MQSLLTRPIGGRTYASLLMAAIIGTGLYLLASYIFLRDDSLGRCSGRSLRADNYIAECAGFFGSYEHPAHLYGLEPQAIENMLRADVLILGSSRAMVGFSTQATVNYFRSLGPRFYLMGFGFNEQYRFAHAVMARFPPNPKAIIVNADPYFIYRTEPQFERLLNGDTHSMIKSRFMRELQRWQRSYCPHTPETERQWICGTGTSLYRSSVDGRWEYQPSPTAASYPVHSSPSRRMEELESVLHTTDEFRTDLPMPGRCIFVTSAPSNGSTDQLAAAVASRLGATVIRPPDGISFQTFDHQHLDPASAETWSAVVLAQIHVRLQSCLRGEKP